MARLDDEQRANLPDRAFAYIDSKGRRRLPINDEAHVRNALSRFNQVRFEDEGARERARSRLLAAARRHGIVPVGFIDQQLRRQRHAAAAGRLVVDLGPTDDLTAIQSRLRAELRDPSLQVFEWAPAIGSYRDVAGRLAVLPAVGEDRAITLIEHRGRRLGCLVHEAATLADVELRRSVVSAVRIALETLRLEAAVDAGVHAARALPTGLVTFLMSDIEDSTGLLHDLGDGYAELLADVRGLQRTLVGRAGGIEVDARADEYFAVFTEPWPAVEAALAIQRAMADRAWPGSAVRVRIGLHHGRPQLTDSGYVGLAVHTTARVCAAGHGGQVVATRVARDALEAAAPAGLQGAPIRFRRLGRYQLAGLHRPEALYQVEAGGLATDFAPLRAPAVADR